MKGAGHRRLLTRVPSAVYDRIDNAVYDTASEAWWQPDAALHQMKHVFNPARVDYAKRKLFEDFKINPSGKRALEVGCGGGILSEEIAGLGFDATGIDPSEPSLRVAADHAQAGGLNIRYLKGVGESLPFPAGSYDVVFCCDVLEHVRDLPKVVSEISRVLKAGGVFIYDTFNRTLISKLVAIKIGQEWKSWAFMPAPPNESSPVDGASGTEARPIRFPDSAFFASKGRRKNVVSRTGRKNPDGRRPQPGGDVHGLRRQKLLKRPSGIGRLRGPGKIISCPIGPGRRIPCSARIFRK